MSMILASECVLTMSSKQQIWLQIFVLIFARYCVGVLDKDTKVMTLHKTELMTMKPHIPGILLSLVSIVYIRFIGQCMPQKVHTFLPHFHTVVAPALLPRLV